MTAFPMLERCFQAQWLGLTDEERAVLLYDRHQNYMTQSGSLETPIWTASSSRTGDLYLLSVKREILLYQEAPCTPVPNVAGSSEKIQHLQPRWPSTGIRNVDGSVTRDTPTTQEWRMPIFP